MRRFCIYCMWTRLQNTCKPDRPPLNEDTCAQVGTAILLWSGQNCGNSNQSSVSRSESATKKQHELLRKYWLLNDALCAKNRQCGWCVRLGLSCARLMIWPQAFRKSIIDAMPKAVLDLYQCNAQYRRLQILLLTWPNTGTDGIYNEVCCLPHLPEPVKEFGKKPLCCEDANDFGFGPRQKCGMPHEQACTRNPMHACSQTCAAWFWLLGLWKAVFW